MIALVDLTQRGAYFKFWFIGFGCLCSVRCLSNIIFPFRALLNDLEGKCKHFEIITNSIFSLKYAKVSVVNIMIGSAIIL